MLARVPLRLLLRHTTLFRGLGEGHILTIDPQDAAAVHRTLEATQRAVDRLLVSNFNTYCQSESPPEKSSIAVTVQNANNTIGDQKLQSGMNECFMIDAPVGSPYSQRSLRRARLRFSPSDSAFIDEDCAGNP